MPHKQTVSIRLSPEARDALRSLKLSTGSSSYSEALAVPRHPAKDNALCVSLDQFDAPRIWFTDRREGRLAQHIPADSPAMQPMTGVRLLQLAATLGCPDGVSKETFASQIAATGTIAEAQNVIVRHYAAAAGVLRAGSADDRIEKAYREMIDAGLTVTYSLLAKRASTSPNTARRWLQAKNLG